MKITIGSKTVDALGFVVDIVDGKESKILIRTTHDLARELRVRIALPTLKLLTLGHRGQQLRGWSGLWSYLGSSEGGHFDTSESKLFDFNANPNELETAVLQALDFPNSGFARFDWNGVSQRGLNGPLAIFARS